MTGALLEVEQLTKHFPITEGIVFRKEVATVKALDGVSLAVRRGETLGIVGESGCGKSTLARVITNLLQPTSGSVRFDGEDVGGLSGQGLRDFRRQVTMIFQDPFASLNPRKRVGFIVAEPLEVHRIGTEAERKRRVQELLEVVGLNAEHYNRFPHEFSGGQRQRIGIARALVAGPRLIVCDEPVSALDVSVQAQILNLLHDLQRELGLTYVFIAHDLSVVRHISDRVAVMYLGKLVELADSRELYAEPRHPYTGALLSAVPIANPRLGRQRRRVVLAGDVPNPIDPPSGCRFHPRCPAAQERCAVDETALLTATAGSTHAAACHFPLDRSAGRATPAAVEVTR
jgi:oligopeptide/dipeptide ABC transporter ATP-binding protein